MRTVVVRYRTRPDRADENQQLVEQVFAQLTERRPAGYEYRAMRLDDGVSFVHVVTELDADGDSLSDLPAFQAFVQGVHERCDEAPVAMGAHVIGAYSPPPA